MKTKLLIEQHFHGCYGIDFNKANVDEILFLSKEIMKEGVGFIFPTLVTDSIENIKDQISIIKEAASKQTTDMAKICGIHLEGIFLNPEKRGIHNKDYFLPPTVENFQLIEDDFIKIVTVAPELSINSGFMEYLNMKNIKIQAGHCVGGDLSKCDGVTHVYNAMSGIVHRGESTALSALINNSIYAEVIADGIHVSDDALKLLFKAKPADKILLVSDCLPCTHSNIKEFTFANEKVYFDGVKATSKDGTLAGSTKLLPEMIKYLISQDMFNPQFIENSYIYHEIEPTGYVEWDDKFNVVNIA